MGYLSPKGRDWGRVVNWDDLAKFYASFTIAWTVILGIGIGWLILHRHLLFLKIRNIPLAIAATCSLHVYLIKILLAYTVNGHFSCVAEFWIMSIYLPFGIALFQANMVQLQSISGQQKKLLEGRRLSSQTDIIPPSRGIRRFWVKWRAMTELERAEVLIAIGMVVQLIVTLAIYLASRKFHGSWGTISYATKSAVACRKGWEWIPSAFWQLLWVWFFGPLILYRVRNINDVHYWRIQTVLCVISGLPGTPLWLAALYSSHFKPVNKYWVPPMWLAPGIIMMQAVTIFFPIFEGYKTRFEHRRALEIIEDWEEKKQIIRTNVDHGSAIGSSVFSAKQPDSSTTSVTSRRRELYSKAALEKALASNAIPLLEFAATREFTGENILFLMQVRDWRAAWGQGSRDPTTVPDQLRYHAFKRAVEIYALSIHTKTARFPVNIAGRIRSDLDAMFGAAAVTMKQSLNDDNVVHPFNDDPICNIELGSLARVHRSLDRDLSRSKSADSRRDLLYESHEVTPSPTRRTGLHRRSIVFDSDSIPAAFGEHVFDAAEQDIKYLVITNTWPKFVDSQESLLL